MGLLSKVKKTVSKGLKGVKKIGKFATKGLGGVLGKLAPAAQKLLKNSPLGKILNKVVPKFAEKLTDLLNPAKLGALFGGVKSPADFGKVLQSVTKNIPGLG